MADPEIADAGTVIAQFRCWVEQVVIGLNLCPFARGPYAGGRVHFVVSAASEPEQLLADLDRELAVLRATDAAVIETTLLIHPHVLTDFIDYNDFLGVVEVLLEQGGYAGEFQVASFHPGYRFAGTESDAAENYTNRSPWPALHLLREAALERALEGYKNPEQIPERNIRTMEKLGAEQMRAILAACLEAGK
ncbi:MAG: DUF1415 domain-containing protein [Thiogranum sp.]